MRLVVAAVGRLKDGAERALFDKYAERLDPAAKAVGLGPVVWHDLRESRAATAAKRVLEEGDALLRHARDAGFLVALDERGTMLSSEAFARVLARTRDEGTKSTAIVIGGPDGLSQPLRASARLVFSLGAITLPHGLARIVLAEQLYRAATILAGHPYHRA